MLSFISFNKMCNGCGMQRVVGREGEGVLAL